MKTFFKHFRSAIVEILGMVAFLLMVSEPDESVYENWTRALFVSKGIAFVLGYASYKLYEFWGRKGLLPDDDYIEDSQEI